MRDLIFVVKNDGTYQKVPVKKLRGQENYSDNFVVIANRIGIVKANIRLLGRTDKVISQFLIPTFEKAEDFIGQEEYFQDYADAKVWRIGVSKTALRDISQSYSGQIEVSFSFMKFVDDERAINNIGNLDTDLPLTAEEGDYLVCKFSSFTKDETTWTYGQLAIYHEGGWVKGGRYRVEGNTTTHKMSVEPTLIGTLREDDIEDEDAVRDALESIWEEVNIKAPQSEVDDIVIGNTIVGRADIAEKDQKGNVIDETYAGKINIGASTTPVDKKLTIRLYTPNQDKVQATPNLSSVTYTIDSATETLAGLMKADDKVKLNALPSHADLINEEGTYQVGISKRAIKDQDGANIKSTYETKANANAQVGDLQGQINQIKGVPHSYGEIQKTNAEITADKTLLTIHVESIKGVAVVNGDLVYDLDNHEWEYNGTTWVDNGEWKQTQIATASEVGVVKGSDDILIDLDGSVEVVKSRQADVAAKDEDGRDLVELELTSEVDRKLLDYATIVDVDAKVFVDADEFAEVKTDKADKVEVRSIGEETITYANGKVSQVESNTILTEVFYDFEGNIDEVHETYKIDNKKYKTTFEKDANGRVNKITKGEL